MLRCHPIALGCARLANVCADPACLAVELRAAAHERRVERADVRAIAAELDAARHSGHVHSSAFAEALLAGAKTIQTGLDAFFHFGRHFVFRRMSHQSSVSRRQNEHEPRHSRWKRVLLTIVVVVAGFFGLVEVLAWNNIKRERARRSYLGDQLFVVEKGRGDPVVFIAGLQGSTRYWGTAFDPLQQDHRLLYVDAYGFGRSPWPLTEPTLEDHMAWLRRTLAARNATSNVTIVAHSFGTILAAHYGARYPDEVGRLVLLGTPLFRGEEDARGRIRDMSQLAALFSLNPILARETCLIMGAFRPLIRSLAPRVSDSVPDAVAEDAVLHDWPSINGAIRNVLLTKPAGKPLEAAGSKAILIYGSRDTVTPLERIREVVGRTGASLILMDGDHHSYVRDGRGIVMDAIRKSAPPSSPRS
ncbi:MAG TPA: alpha/beta hydrolase [Thermoanaerobaculia bacterium]|nr:alpha/beta hydrolase [Thermoanaerobaculia bacterium]